MLSKDASNAEYPIRNLKEDQTSFLWHNQLHKFMITLENADDSAAKKEMIERSLERYKSNKNMIYRIDEFNRQSLDNNKEKAIHSYTENSFIHECINTVLRRENVSEVYSYRYLIKLICRQLEERHKKFIREYRKSENSASLHLYRGLPLRLEDINFLHSNINNLISLNGFVSTSKDKGIAMDFIRRHRRQGFVSALLKISVDMGSHYDIAFADISDLSEYPEEKEVLFSLGSIFRVKSVKFDAEQNIYVIRLSLSPHDQLTVIKYIHQAYPHDVNSIDQSVLFGKLLFEMGEYQSAIKYFQYMLAHLQSDNNPIRAIHLNNLGVCYNEIGKTNEALDCYRKALEIYREGKDKHGLSSCCRNVIYSFSLFCFISNVKLVVDSKHSSCSTRLRKSPPMGVGIT